MKNVRSGSVFVLALVFGFQAAAVIAAPGVILNDDFESYADQAAFASAWIEDGSSPYYLDNTRGHNSAQSVKLESASGGGGVTDRWFRDLGSTYNGTDAEPLVFSYDLYLNESGGSTMWDYAFNSCDIRSYSGGGYKQGDLQDLVSIGVSWYTDQTRYQGRNIIAGQYDSPLGYVALDASTAPQRSSGWHEMKVVITSSKITYMVDGAIGKELPKSLSQGINCVVLGSGVISDHVMWVDNLKVEIVPEPASLSMLALGAVALIRRRKGRVC